MATILTHPAVPLAVGLGLGHRFVSWKLLLTGVALSALPDLDTIAFRFGIPYGSEFGHRGFSHSLLFGVLVALLIALLLRRERFGFAFFFLCVSIISHGFLDAFTNGGKGVAFLWPFSQQRFFAPAQVIEVAPLSLARFLSSRGAVVMISELFWVWLPCLAIAVIAWYFSKTYLEQHIVRWKVGQ